MVLLDWKHIFLKTFYFNTFSRGSRKFFKCFLLGFGASDDSWFHQPHFLKNYFHTLSQKCSNMAKEFNWLDPPVQNESKKSSMAYFHLYFSEIPLYIQKYMATHEICKENAEPFGGVKLYIHNHRELCYLSYLPWYLLPVYSLAASLWCPSNTSFLHS